MMFKRLDHKFEMQIQMMAVMTEYNLPEKLYKSYIFYSN